MSEQLENVLGRLRRAKLERGRLTRIATDTGISYRTIYGMMRAKQTPTSTTLDKLTAYFKKEDRRAKP